MMKLSEYAQYDARALAQLIHRGEVSKQEVTETAQHAIEVMNTQLNFVSETFTPIMGNADGPLAGVPFVVKDLSVQIQGIPHHAGTRMLAGNTCIPAESSELFKRFQKAGLTTLATTTTPEFGMTMTTESQLYGPTLNPWNTTKSPGGSSGGSCVAVACGAVPIAHANDAAGSIRVPAASCGLVGLKPSRGRVPQNSIFPVMGLSAELGVSRTVGNTALLLDVFQGNNIGDFVQIQAPSGSYSQAITEKTPRLHIACATHLHGTQKPSSAMISALEKTAQHLINMGHHVEYASPHYDYERWFSANGIAFYSGIAAEIKRISASLGIEADLNTVEAVTLACAQFGEQLTIHDINDAWQTVHATCQSVDSFMQHYDALLLPTTVGGAIDLGALNQNDPSQPAATWANKNFTYFPYTALFNMTGQPAISIPVGIHEGLPLGAQIVGRMGDEKTILQLASDLEQAQPWADYRPSVSLLHQ